MEKVGTPQLNTAVVRLHVTTGHTVATELGSAYGGGDRHRCIFLYFLLFISINLYIKGAIDGQRVQRGGSASSGSCIVTRLGVERCL